MANTWETRGAGFRTGAEVYREPTHVVRPRNGAPAYGCVPVASRLNPDGRPNGGMLVQLVAEDGRGGRGAALVDVGAPVLAPIVGPDARMMTHGEVYTSREGTNVIIPGTGPRGEGNHWHAAPRGPVLDYVRQAIRRTIAAEAVIGAEHDRRVAQCFMTPPAQVQPGPGGTGLGPWARRPYRVAVDQAAPGHYRFTIWQSPED